MWDALSASLLQNTALLSQNWERFAKELGLMGEKRETEAWQIWIKIDYATRALPRVETSNLSTNACLHAVVATRAFRIYYMSSYLPRMYLLRCKLTVAVRFNSPSLPAVAGNPCSTSVIPVARFIHDNRRVFGEKSSRGRDLRLHELRRKRFVKHRYLVEAVCLHSSAY